MTNYFSGAPTSDVMSPEKKEMLLSYGDQAKRRHGPSSVRLPSATVSSAGDSDEDRSSSCGSSVSSESVSSGQSSGPPRKMTKSQVLKEIVRRCQLTADSSLPALQDWKRVTAADPSLLIAFSQKERKSLSGFASETRKELRAEVVVNELRRSVHLPDIVTRVEEELKRRKWSNTKLLQACLSRCNKLAALKETTAHSKVADALRDSQDRITKSILKQDWPLVRIGLVGDMGKGAYAAKVIPAGTVICDYHGELCDEATGRRRYEVEYKDRPDNCYMFCFQFEGKTYYIDAVRKCPCSDQHVRDKIKGRYLNNSRKSPNVVVKPARVNGLVTLLMLTKVKVEQYAPLVFDYNCHKDVRPIALDG